MADRKKVQKIRTKRTVKFKAPKKSDVNMVKSKKTSTSAIHMTADKQNNSEKRKRPPQRVAKSTTNTAYGNSADHKYINPKNDSKKSKPSFSVIRGKKGEIKKKRIITVCISVALIISVLIFCFTSPTGPVERITNSFALIGEGEYPAALSGTEVLSVQTVSNKYFALTNSHLCGYNFSGKNFILLQHNFSNPVLKVSKERALVYNRESNRFIIANNSEALFDESLEQSIFCADISYDGSVAFACDSPSYASQIMVFDKNMEQYYTWYLADGLVSDITLSNDGQYIAFAVLKVKDGAFSSEIYCLDTEKKEPVYVNQFSNETVYKIESVSSSNFIYTSDKKIAFVDWESGETINKNNYEAPTYYAQTSEYHLALYGEAGSSTIVLYDSSGEIKNEFEYNGIIDNVSVFDERIYILSGNNVVYFKFSDKDRKSITLESKPEYILGVENGFLSFKNININFNSAK